MDSADPATDVAPDVAPGRGRVHPDAPADDLVLDPNDPVSGAFRAAVSTAITAFLDRQAEVLAPMGPDVAPLLELARSTTSGGKRLRPAFAVWGYVAAGGLPTGTDVGLDALVAAAASLDLLHVSALVHDDVMDGSDLRRGRPAAHRQFAARHVAARWSGDDEAFGRAGAILLGDLLLMWSAELLHRSGLDPLVLDRGLPLLEAMRTEVTGGQYLDMVAAHRPPAAELADALDRAAVITEYKSARYTVQRPCQFGAALADGDPALLAGLASYASPLGRAFQYRDDLLGIFGDAEVTGKPAGDDLREGKRTVLVAHAYDRTDPAGKSLLDTGLGDSTLDPTRIAALQQVIADSGAEAAVETMIETLHAEALTALAATACTPEGRTALTALADAAVARVT